MNLDSLLGALAGIPKLHDAACVGRAEEFDLRDISDPDRAEVEAAALAICLDTPCPALAACRDWVDSLPARRRPTGVVAARVIRPRAPRKTAQTPAETRMGIAEGGSTRAVA